MRKGYKSRNFVNKENFYSLKWCDKIFTPSIYAESPVTFCQKNHILAIFVGHCEILHKTPKRIYLGNGEKNFGYKQICLPLFAKNHFYVVTLRRPHMRPCEQLLLLNYNTQRHADFFKRYLNYRG